jgi:hypothetical protein
MQTRRKRKWWTRSQRVRTAGELAFEAILFEATLPAYRRIAEESSRLQILGLSHAAIGRHLGVTDKTVAKALAWLKGGTRVS